MNLKVSNIIDLNLYKNTSQIQETKFYYMFQLIQCDLGSFLNSKNTC